MAWAGLVEGVVNTVDKSVAKAIVEGRQRKGLTQKDLATVPDQLTSSSHRL